MNSCRIFFFLALVSLLFCGDAFAQVLQSSPPVKVSLPGSAAGEAGTTVRVPITVGELAGGKVLSFQMVIVFDKTVLRGVGASTAGTLAEPFDPPIVDNTLDGELIVSVFGHSELSGSGTLINIIFDVVGQPGASTILKFIGFIFNTGDPPAEITNGHFTVLPARVPAIDVTPISHDFGEVEVGSSAMQSFVISNSGTADLQVSDVRIVGMDSDQFGFAATVSPFTLAPGQSQNISVRFHPDSDGLKSAVLQITSNDPDQATVNVNLDGAGKPKPQPNILVQPAAYDFGDVMVGAIVFKTFIISNDGTADLVLNAAKIVGVDKDQFTIESVGTLITLASGDSQSFTISFKPLSIGNKSASLQIFSNDPDQATFGIMLTGNGVPAPAPNIAVQPADYDFGEVRQGSVASKSFVISNNGSADLLVNNVSLAGANLDQFALLSGRTSFTLMPGESEKLDIRFRPTSEGVKTASLQVASNDPDTPLAEIGLTGTGLPLPQPKMVVSPSSHDYGLVVVGTLATKNFIITNSGLADLTVNSISLSGAYSDQFKIVTNSGMITLIPGESHNLIVIFQPTDLGSKKANLQIFSNDPDQAILNVTLSGEGISPLQPDITVDPANHDFGKVLIGSVETKTFVVSNDGVAALQVNVLNLSGSDASQFELLSANALFILPPGASSSFEIRFQPDAPGVKKAELEITSNDPDEQIVTVELTGFAFEELTMQTTITSPQNGELICAENSTVTGEIVIHGGIPPYSIACEVNGVPATVVGNLFSATIALVPGENQVVVNSTVGDTRGVSKTSNQSIILNRPQPLACAVTISTPQGDTTISNESIRIGGRIEVSGGQPPFSVSCQINGKSVALSQNAFSVLAPLEFGENRFTVTCSILDECGTQTVCTDSVIVFRKPKPLICEVEFLPPEPGTIIRDARIKVMGVFKVSGGVPPIQAQGKFNGTSAVAVKDTLMAIIPLTMGANTIHLEAKFTDSWGTVSTCSDTMIFKRFPQQSSQANVLYAITEDKTELVKIDFHTSNPVVSRVGPIFFKDKKKKKIKKIVAMTWDPITNCVLLLSRKSDGTIYKIKSANIKKASSTGVTATYLTRIEIEDIKSLAVNPVTGELYGVDDDEQELVKIDRASGRVKRIKRLGFKDIRGLAFSINRKPVLYGVDTKSGRLVVINTSSRTNTSAYRPHKIGFDHVESLAFAPDGKLFGFAGAGKKQLIKIDPNSGIGKSLSRLTGKEDKIVGIAFLAPERLMNGSRFLSPVYKQTQLTLPDVFTLEQNYPNPFNPSTKIRFVIPSVLQNKAKVELRIHNILGQLVRELLNESMVPGQYEVEWDGRDSRGLPAPSGIYLYQIKVQDFQATRRMLILK